MYKNLIRAPNGQDYKYSISKNSIYGTSEEYHKLAQSPITGWSLLGGFDFSQGTSAFNQYTGSLLYIHKIRVKVMVDTSDLTLKSANHYRMMVLFDNAATVARTKEMCDLGLYPVSYQIPGESAIHTIQPNHIGFMYSPAQLLFNDYDAILNDSFEFLPGQEKVVYYNVPPSVSDINVTNLDRYEIVMDETRSTDAMHPSFVLEKEITFKPGKVARIRDVTAQSDEFFFNTVYGTNIPWFGIIQDNNREPVPYAAEITVFYIN